MNQTEMKKHVNEETKELELPENNPITGIVNRAENLTIEKLRMEGTYNEFKLCASMCLPACLNAKHWKRNKSSLVLSDFISVSDEALAYIVLENNIEEWKDIAKGIEVRSRASKNRKTKYTHGGTNNNGTRKGWSIKGLKRFNQIFQEIKVKRDTTESKGKEKRLLDEWSAGQRADRTNAENNNDDSSNEEEKEDLIIASDFDFE
jgi:hypothetical protein